MEWHRGICDGYGNQDGYGFLRFGNGAQPYRLVLFVHGIRGTADGTWGDLPLWLQRAAYDEVDVMSYGYPAQLWQAASVVSAAEGLNTVLKLPEFRRYREIYAFGHSTGGLVLKEVVRGDLEHSDPSVFTADQRKDFPSLLSSRLRRIYNIAVPHLGGRRLVTNAGIALYPTIIWPWSFALALCRRRRKPFGYNRIIHQLRYHNKWVRGLEEKYTTIRSRCETAHLTFPESRDILADNDEAVPRYKSRSMPTSVRDGLQVYSDRSYSAIRSSHARLQLPRTEKEPLPQLLMHDVHVWTDTPSFDPVARALARRARDLTQDQFDHLGVKGVIGSPVLEAPAQFPPLFVGSQRAILDRLRGPGTPAPTLVTVTGSAGVGKSVVLRQFTHGLSDSYLQDNAGQIATGNAPLPIFVSLQRFESPPDLTSGGPTQRTTRPQTLLAYVLKEWCDWASRLLEDAHDYDAAQCVGVGWLQKRLREQPTFVIIDSVDEFLSRCPQVPFTVFLGMISGFRLSMYDPAGKTSGRLILGIRNTMPGHSSFAALGLGTEHLSLRELTLEEAEGYCTGYGEWARPLMNGELARTVLSLLVVTRLAQNGRFRQIRVEDLRGKGQLLLHVIDANLDASGLVGAEVRMESGQEAQPIITSKDDWLDALSIVAWARYANGYTEPDLAQMNSATSQINLAWPTSAEGWTGMRLVAMPTQLQKLVERTVFLSVTKGRWRFEHVDFEDVLAARYMHACVRARHFADFGSVSSNHEMLAFAAEQLTGMPFDETDANELLNTARVLKSPLVAANVIALLPYRYINVTGAAVRILAAESSSVGNVAQVVAFAALGYRALSDENETRRAAIRDALGQPFLKTIQEQTSTWCSRSLAWCYLRAFGTPVDRLGDWPAVTASQFYSRSTDLEVICTVNNHLIRCSKTDRSLQRAFARIQQRILSDPLRAISLVHYLYLLVLARCNEGSASDVDELIAPIVAKKSEYEAAFGRYPVREVNDLYQACQSAFLQV